MPPSAPEVIHPVAPEALDGWVRTMSSTFLQASGETGADRWVARVRRDWEPERAWGVRDRGRWVATLRTLSRTLTVPGVGGTTEVVPADALTNVTVAATHRRRGFMSRMLEASLRAARERGDPVSILISAAWPIYGRFGYAPAAFAARYRLAPDRPGCEIAGDVTRVRQVDRAEFGDLAPAIYAAARRERAGQIDRDGAWWDRTLGRDGWPEVDAMPHNWLVHEGDDGPDGLLAWSARREAGFLPPLGAVDVWQLSGVGDAAYRDLWAYLTGLDGVDEVRLSTRPVDERARWLLGDGRTLIVDQVVDFMWLRLLDVPAALAARRYAVAGELVLEVIDDTAVSVAGRYRLHAAGDAARCEPTGAPPDLTITQAALASIYLGTVGLRELRVAGAVHEHAPHALSRAEVMFATPLAPWNGTGF